MRQWAPQFQHVEEPAPHKKHCLYSLCVILFLFVLDCFDSFASLGGFLHQRVVLLFLSFILKHLLVSLLDCFTSLVVSWAALWGGADDLQTAPELQHLVQTEDGEKLSDCSTSSRVCTDIMISPAAQSMMGNHHRRLWRQIYFLTAELYWFEFGCNIKENQNQNVFCSGLVWQTICIIRTSLRGTEICDSPMINVTLATKSLTLKEERY